VKHRYKLYDGIMLIILPYAIGISIEIKEKRKKKKELEQGL